MRWCSADEVVQMTACQRPSLLSEAELDVVAGGIVIAGDNITLASNISDSRVIVTSLSDGSLSVSVSELTTVSCVAALEEKLDCECSQGVQQI